MQLFSLSVLNLMHCTQGNGRGGDPENINVPMIRTMNTMLDYRYCVSLCFVWEFWLCFAVFDVVQSHKVCGL